MDEIEEIRNMGEIGEDKISRYFEGTTPDINERVYESKRIGTLKQVLKDGVVSFAYWTGTLTPYMVLVVKVNLEQYIAWLGMQALLVPPLGIGFSYYC